MDETGDGGRGRGQGAPKSCSVPWCETSDSRPRKQGTSVTSQRGTGEGPRSDRCAEQRPICCRGKKPPSPLPPAPVPVTYPEGGRSPRPGTCPSQDRRPHSPHSPRLRCFHTSGQDKGWTARDGPSERGVGSVGGEQPCQTPRVYGFDIDQPQYPTDTSTEYQ